MALWRLCGLTAHMRGASLAIQGARVLPALQPPFIGERGWRSGGLGPSKKYNHLPKEVRQGLIRQKKLHRLIWLNSKRSEATALEKAEELFREQLAIHESGPVTHPYGKTFGAMADAYGKRRMFDKMEQMWNDSLSYGFQPTQRFYAIMIKRYARQGMVKEMEDYYNKMLEAGFATNRQCQVTMLRGYAQARDEEKMAACMEVLKEMGLDHHLYVYTIWGRFYGRMKDVNGMEKLVRRIMDAPRPYSDGKIQLVINSYAGDVLGKEDILSQLKARGIVLGGASKKLIS